MFEARGRFIFRRRPADRGAGRDRRGHLMGVGMTVVLILDASIVRVLLVPAAMRVLGPASSRRPAGT
jgi:hypothetical protein